MEEKARKKVKREVTPKLKANDQKRLNLLTLSHPSIHADNFHINVLVVILILNSAT